MNFHHESQAWMLEIFSCLTLDSNLWSPGVSRAQIKLTTERRNPWIWGGWKSHNKNKFSKADSESEALRRARLFLAASTMIIYFFIDWSFVRESIEGFLLQSVLIINSSDFTLWELFGWNVAWFNSESYDDDRIILAVKVKLKEQLPLG